MLQLIQAWCMYTVFDPCNADTARKTVAYQSDFWPLQSVGTKPDYAEWKVDVLCRLPEIPDLFLILQVSPLK